MTVEQSVEWELAGEAEVLGENVLQCHFVRQKSHMTWLGLEPGPPRWEAWAMARNGLAPTFWWTVSWLLLECTRSGWRRRNATAVLPLSPRVAPFKAMQTRVTVWRCSRRGELTDTLNTKHARGKNVRASVPKPPGRKQHKIFLRPQSGVIMPFRIEDKQINKKFVEELIAYFLWCVTGCIKKGTYAHREQGDVINLKSLNNWGGGAHERWADINSKVIP
jgi:hypothetical protein